MHVMTRVLLLVAAAAPVRTRDRKDLSSSLLPGDALVAPSAPSDADLERRVVTCRDLYNPPRTLLYGIDDAQIWYERFCPAQEGKAALFFRGDLSWLATLGSQIMSRFRGSARRNSGWRKLTIGLLGMPAVKGRLEADFKKMGLRHAFSGAVQLFYHLVISCDVHTSLSFLLYRHKDFGGLHPMAQEWRYNKDGAKGKRKDPYFTSEEYVVLTAFMRSQRARTGLGGQIRLYEVDDPNHTRGFAGVLEVDPALYVLRVDLAASKAPDPRARADRGEFEDRVKRMQAYMQDKFRRLARGSVSAAARCAAERRRRAPRINKYITVAGAVPSDALPVESVATSALYKCLFSNEPPCYVAPPRRDARQLAGASSSRSRRRRGGALTEKEMKGGMFFSKRER